MGLKDIGMTLPPGFRFYPNDEELVCHYLYKKIANEEVVRGTLVDVDLHTCEPWQLPDAAKLNSSEWYFFSFRDRKYATGYRTNRATVTGYWKATGKDRAVVDPSSNVVVGMRKTLVFYKNRAPNGIKTGWIMHEFRLENPLLSPKEDWVLCRVFNKLIRSENNDKFDLHNGYNIPMGGTCCPNPTICHNQPQNPSISLQTLSTGGCFSLSREEDDEDHHLGNISHHNQGTKFFVETKYEYDYGFFFDSSFDCVPMRLDYDI